VGDDHRFTGELVPVQIGIQSSVFLVKGSGYRFGRSAQCSSEVTMGVSAEDIVNAPRGAQ
jgi:hypothetical protein